MRDQAREASTTQDGDHRETGSERAPGRDQFHDGPIPPVIAQADDANVRELKAKVGELVDKKFSGDFKKAFDFYDADHDGGINKDEVTALLKDAGVGSGLTRGMWANGILDKLDTSKDTAIQWSEFEAVFKTTA